MKKGLIITAAIAGTLLLGGGSAYAAGQIAKSSSIDQGSAQNFAFVDAGVLPEDAEVYETEFEYKSGRFIYEIEFIANGTRYDYKIDAKSGSVIEKEVKAVPGYENSTAAPVAPAETKPTEPANATEPTKPAAPAEPTKPAESAAVISADQAKQTALQDAGVKETAITIRKLKREMDDGRLIYDVEFVSADTEYEYEISAENGAILEKSIEPLDLEDRVAAPANTPAAQPAAPAETQAPAPAQTASPAAPSQPAQSAPAQTAPAQTAPAQTAAMISADQAKQTALQNAGVAEANAVLRKLKLERDDGRMIYDVEFTSGGKEYEYEIDAANGAVLERSIEAIESDDDEDDD